MKRVAAVVLLILFCIGLCTAQVTIPSPTPPPTPVRTDLGSPQATVQTFVNSIRSGDLSAARQTMDLSDVPFPVRDTEGNRYARLLIAVLARIPGFQVENTPAQTKETSYSITVVGENHRTVGHLVIDKQETGTWQFSSSTITNLPHLFLDLENFPQANELGHFPDPEPDPSMEVRALMPSFLLHAFLWLEVWQWIGLLAFAIVVWLVFATAKGILRVVLQLFFNHWDNVFTKQSLRSLRRSAALLTATFVGWALYEYLGLSGPILLVLVVLLKLSTIFGSGWLLGAILDVTLDSFSARASELVHRADRILIPIAKKFVRLVIFLGATIAFAASMSVNVAGLVTGLGIGGLVVALAGKDSVENIFGSFTILFDMPFGIGDFIRMGDVKGNVEEINLRSTRIRTSEDTIITLPNSNLIKASVENFGARRYRHVKLVLPISYLNKLDRVQDFMVAARKYLVENKSVRPGTSYVQLNTLTDSSFSVLVECDLVTDVYAEELKLREELLAKLVDLATSAKVVLGALSWNPIPPPPTVVANP
jgi:MscS family membrane protein